MDIIKKSTPNFYAGRSGHKPEAIVIHIMEGSLAGTDNWFSTPASQVSAHYGIGKNGEVHQYVEEVDTAWHAGSVVSPTWTLIRPVPPNPNFYTIGIEHEGFASDVWPEAQRRVSAELIFNICKRWDIPLDRKHIIGHYEIRATKPNCPAVNKIIIDDLIQRAKSIAAPSPVEEGIKKIKEGLALIEKSL